MGEETERTERADLPLDNTPRGVHIHRIGSSDFVTGPGEHPLERTFVLVAIERTGTVDQRTARTQRPPRLTQDIVLSRSALPHVVLAPLPARSGILAEHALARAGGIDGHHVEPRLAVADRMRLTRRDHHAARTPLAHVVGQHGGTAAVDLVGDDQSPAPDKRGVEGRLAARGRTKVEDPRPGGRDLLQQTAHELRGRLLHVVGSGMEVAVEGERRAARKQEAVGAPRNAAGGREHRKHLRHPCGLLPAEPLRLGGIHTDADARLAVEGAAEGLALRRPEVAKDPLDECPGQLHLRHFAVVRSASRRAQIFSSTAGSETKSSWSLSMTSTSPS